MLFATIGQGYVFLWMMGAGLLIGALYAFAAAMRRLLCAGFWLALLIDVLTGLGAGLILIAALVTGSYGQLRLYEMLGALAGTALFTLGVEPPIRQGLGALFRVLKRLFDRISGNRLIKVIFR